MLKTKEETIMQEYRRYQKGQFRYFVTNVLKDVSKLSVIDVENFNG